MIDIIILGLLYEGHALTSYDIKKAMENSTDMFMTTSFGSINPGLKKLLEKGCLISEEKYEGKRKKIYYYITELGKDEFDKRIRMDFGDDKFKLGQILRIFFYDKLDYKEKIVCLDDEIVKANQVIEKLSNIKSCADEELAKYGLTMETYEPARYRMDALEFGLAYEKFLIDWFNDYKNVLRNREGK